MTDPYRVLGLSEGAGDAEIRAAYLAAVRACPPEHDRQRFEQVRAAYEAVADEPRRLAHAMFDTSVPTVHELAEALSAEWRAGPPQAATLLRVLGGTR
jgi:curved DNA-binding protein CbpA